MKIVFFILVLCISINLSATESESEKITPNLQKALSSVSFSSDSTLSLWLILDKNETSKVPVKLSEKSLQRRKRVDPDNYLIDSKDSTFSQSVLDSVVNSGAEIRHILNWFNAVTVQIPANKVQRLSSLPFVKNIDIIHKLKSQRVFQVEPLKDLKTGLSKSLALSYGLSQFQNSFIKADVLHDIGLTGKGVRIAMFDTGFNTEHSVFDSLNIINTYNFIDNIVDVTQEDCLGGFSQSNHGTMTLGVVGSYLPDTLIGVAYNAEFLLAKTEISCNGTEIYQEEDNWIAAAEWADQQGADIINSSLGYMTFQDSVGYTYADLDGDTPRITQAADFASSKNILVINSAGNERNKPWHFIVTPADGDSVIAVGATNPDSSFAIFSSPGPTADGRIKPDISTIGTSISSSHYLGGYVSGLDGTSFSSPMVAGGVALALEHDPTLTADELRELIRRSGNSYDNPDNDFGYGLFDAVKTANIISFLKPHSFYLTADSLNRFLVETDGRSIIVPVISILDTIPGITFTDNGDGTGYLDIIGTEINQSVKVISVVADVGYFADTTDLTLVTEDLLQSKLIIGPNPCSDFLNIYFYDIQNVKSIAIYKISGEKVWEKLNDLTINADINRIEARWNCSNQSGEVVADGAYIIVVSAGGKQFYQKVLKIE